MSLTSALSAALSGLQVSQANLALVSANVANADTPGYMRKTLDQIAIAAAGNGGVRAADVQRELDEYIQRQLRTENSGAAYADTRAQFYQQLQDVYGQPGAANALETVYNNFTGALQALATSPDDSSAQSAVISSAQLLAQQLNQMTASIQALRENAELGISNAVSEANNAMSQIAALNQRIAASPAGAPETAALMDQRDAYIDTLSKLMDINVIRTGTQLSVFTNSGIELVGAQAARLSFNAQGTMTAGSRWNADPALSTVGTITLTTVSGSTIDLIQDRAIRSGTIAAYVQMRDQDLVQAQNQIDAIAAAMASALSDKTTNGSPVANGFDIDIGSLLAGNTINVTYTDTATSTTYRYTFMRVDDAAALPLSNSATADPNDIVVGLDFSGGIASVITQINTALASTGLTASNPAGTTLELVDDGGVTATLNSLSTTVTATSLAGGSAELPLFLDGAAPYSGAVTSAGSESIGFAGRIVVNPAVAADPSSLVKYQAGTPAGDNTRPNFIYQQLTSASLTFPADTGIGSATTPFTGSITHFLQQVISQQGEAANSAENLKQGQDVVLASLQQRFNRTSGVDIDQEMANLLTLQQAYSANARVFTTVNDMFATLLQMT
jgi:flagellar hook-associated protein 1 FlgK